MDPPVKKSNYSDQVTQSQFQDNTLSFLPVPGPQGPQGQKGDKGERGPQGEKGDKGDRGEPGKNGTDGKNGTNGKDGKSMLSPSNQQIGWAYYGNKTLKQTRTGIDQGEDGWVDLAILSLDNDTCEEYLPNKNVSLWNTTSFRLNFKGLETGSIITIRYNIMLTTYTNNTEVWFKTLLFEEEKSPISYVGNLKYQYDYEFSVEQNVFMHDNKYKSFGGIPQIRTDNPCEAVIKSIYVSVS